MIKHVVVFDFSSANAATEKAITEAILGMKDQIPELHSLTFGRNISDRSQAFSHCLVAEMDDMDAVGRYLNHPAHKAVVKTHIEPNSKCRFILDYVM